MRTRRQLTTVALGVCGDRTEAEDVVQETYLRAYRSFDGFRGDAAVSSWLHRIAVNLAIDRCRNRGRRLLREATELGADGVPPVPDARPDTDPGRMLEAMAIRGRVAASTLWRTARAIRPFRCSSVRPARTPRPEVRERAIEALTELATDRTLETVADLAANDRDEDVRSTALEALADWERGDGIAFLVRVARTHADPETRREALEWLAESEHPLARKGLLQLERSRG